MAIFMGGGGGTGSNCKMSVLTVLLCQMCSFWFCRIYMNIYMLDRVHVNNTKLLLFHGTCDIPKSLTSPLFMNGLVDEQCSLLCVLMCSFIMFI